MIVALPGLFFYLFLTVFLLIAKCREPVGMESGGIPDSAITASSIYDDMVGPDSAR